MRKVIIVGGVAAGMSAASKAKREKKDLEITVYEMTDIISWGSCGLPYYVGNFYDDSKRMIAKPLEQFKKEGITVKMKHEVIGVDIEKKEVSVKNLATQEIFKDRYDELIITTGASAVKPPIKNIDLENVFTLKEFSDGIVLKKAMMKPENKIVVIIGAGYIGLEAAEAAVNLKKEVRIIQLGDRVIPGSFDKEITDIMEEEIRGHKDVFLNLDEAVSEFEGKDGRVSGVKTNKGVYPADIVILATGVRPNTKFLEGTGIETLKNGAIVIDGRGRSSIKDIYAAGDCATVYHKLKKENVYIPLATTSNKIGRVVGENLAGKDREFKGTLGSAAIKVLDLEAGRTGISSEEAEKMGINYKSVFVHDKNQTSYYPGQEDIYIKIIYDADTKRILGGQLIGKKGAVLRVDVLAAAIDKGMTTDELAYLDLCYAPPFSLTWDPLNVAGNLAK